MRVAFVTATMGGAGHLARGVAVRAGLQRARFAGSYRVFGPPIPYPAVRMPEYVVATVSEQERNDPIRARESDLARHLVEYDPDVVLVDHFWCPLQNALRALSRADIWLLSHAAPATWFVGPKSARFRPELYRRRIAVEPPNLHQLPEQIDPIVTCNPDEMLPPSALRHHFGIEVGTHLTLVAQTGMAGEAEALARRHRPSRGVLRVLSLRDPNGLFPLAPYLAGADFIIGGAGYNLFWETRWLGLAQRTLCVPQVRGMESQAGRTKIEGYRMRENGADRLARWIIRGG